MSNVTSTAVQTTTDPKFICYTDIHGDEHVFLEGDPYALRLARSEGWRGDAEGAFGPCQNNRKELLLMIWSNHIAEESMTEEEALAMPLKVHASARRAGFDGVAFKAEEAPKSSRNLAQLVGMKVRAGYYRYQADESLFDVYLKDGKEDRWFIASVTIDDEGNITSKDELEVKPFPTLRGAQSHIYSVIVAAQAA